MVKNKEWFRYEVTFEQNEPKGVDLEKKTAILLVKQLPFFSLFTWARFCSRLREILLALFRIL